MHPVSFSQVLPCLPLAPFPELVRSTRPSIFCILTADSDVLPDVTFTAVWRDLQWVVEAHGIIITSVPRVLCKLVVLT